MNGSSGASGSTSKGWRRWNEDERAMRRSASVSSSIGGSNLLGGSSAAARRRLTVRRLLRKLYSALWIHKDDTVRLSSESSSESAQTASTTTTTTTRVLSPFGWLVVLSLMFLGIRELLSHPNTAAKRNRRIAKVSRKHPRRDLERLTAMTVTDEAGQAKVWMRQEEEDERVYSEQGDTTAIVLHWKRTDNVRLIVAHLCQFTFFKNVLVWNNDPETPLSAQTFASAGCPAGVLRIHNSPKNMLFFGRYLACASASTPNCFFQDDDWLVTSVRAMYAQFKNDPEGPVVVSTDARTSGMYALEWCFFNQPMHACFAWMGTGAFVSKWQVSMFVATATALPFTRDELVHADNYFAVFQNEPPYVLSSTLTPLPVKGGYSDGTGLKRNKAHIQRAISYISDLLNVTSVPLATEPIAKAPLYVYREDQPVPLLPHPHTHHARHVSPDDDGVTLVTNIHMLPSPSALTYPGPDHVQLEQWEDHLGHLARGWMEGTEVYREEEAWFVRWHYAHIFEHDGAGWRSPDVVRKGDYVGLALLSRIKVNWHTAVRLSWEAAVPNDDLFTRNVAFDISIDGSSWGEAKVISVSCEPTRRSVDRPDPPFPPIHGLSSEARAIREAAGSTATAGLSTFFGSAPGTRWTACSVVIDSSLGYSAGEFGWRYVRMRALNDMNDTGWAMRALTILTL